LYTKIIKKSGKEYRYYYHNVKVNGRVKNIFLGQDKKKAVDKLNQLSNDRAHKILLSSAPSPERTNYYFNYAIIVLLLVLGIGVLYFNNITGLIIYEPSIVTLNVNNDVSQEASIYVNVFGQEKSKIITEFLNFSNSTFINELNIDINDFDFSLDPGTYSFSVSLIDNSALLAIKSHNIEVRDNIINKTNLTENLEIKVKDKKFNENIIFDEKIEEEFLNKDKVRVIIKRENKEQESLESLIDATERNEKELKFIRDKRFNDIKKDIKEGNLNNNELNTALNNKELKDSERDNTVKILEELVKDNFVLEIKQSVDDIEALEITRDELNKLRQSNEIKEILLDKQVNLFIDESISLTKINKVKDEGYSGNDKKICILDTGINYNLFNLELNNTVFGYDFVNNDNDPLDDHGHGTSVSNVILKIAPNAKIYSVKVVNSQGLGYESDVLAGLKYCIDNDVDVISFSIGSSLSNGYCDSDLVASKSNYAVKNGIYVVAATGNDASLTSIRSPSCASSVTRVSSSTKQDSIASFSNINNLIDLVAPGKDISTIDLNGNNIVLSGTSFSAPIVSGSALLILENRTINPKNLTYLLRSTSEIINYNNINYNRLNLFNALINNKTNEPYNYDANQSSIEMGNFTILADTQYPEINFTYPTFANGTTSRNLTNLINITINESSLNTFIFNWNTTNFTIYNDSIIFMLNLNNITEIGEGAFNKTRAVDVSNYSNNFTCINAGVSCNWTTSGKHNGGIGFDADDILVMIRQNDDVNAHIPNDGEPFTISFWVKKNSTSNAVLFGASNFPTTGFDIEDDGASSVTFFVFPEGTGGCGTAGNPCFSRSLINDNIWHNVVGVYDPAGSAMKLYLDGVQRDSQTANSSSYQRMDNGMLTFGVFNEGGGYMDEAIMWNIPLTAQQINQSYYSNLYKYQTDTWNYITNQTVNVNGTYTYLGYAKDTSGNSNMTETRTLIVNTSFVQAASVNSIPNNVSSLKINSTFSLQTNLTTENLQVRFNVSDPNAGDTLNYSIQWFRNNITNFTLTNIAVSNPGTGIETLQHQNTTKGDLWSAQVLVCDNSNACNSFINTSQLLILNAIPNVTSNLQPLNNTLVRTLTPNLNWTNSSDLDSDALYYLLDISNVSDFSNIIYNGKDTYVNYTGSPGLDGGFSGTMAASLDPRGITTNGSDFWILDPSTKYIYHFNSTGGNITGTPGLYGGFSLSVVATVINAQFITSNGSDFWISNSDPDYVYHINANGINMSDGFDLRSAYFSINPTGITTNGSDFWVVDSGSGFFIYHFNSTGGNLTDGYNLIKAYSPEASPRGITTNGSDFWFTDNSRDFVYHFDYYGNNITDGFSTISAYSSDTINTWGIETNKRLNHGNLKSPSDFWITDPNANYVYHFKGAVNEQGIQGNITQHNVTVALQDNTNYYWRIKAFDGSQESNYVYGNFTISTPNIAPNFTQGYPQINSTDGLNQSSKNLRVMILATDNDTSDRTLRYNLTVFTNNITNFTLNNIYYISGALQLENIQSANLTKGQTWKAMINLFDNDTNIISNTSELLILNNASTITQPAFNQTNYNIYHIISASLVVTDVDSDLSNVTFEWFKNNAIIRRTTTNNLNNGTNTSDILTPSNFGQNDNIIVQAFAFDGTINSTLINSTTITIQGINNASVFTQGYPQINSTDGLNKTNINLTAIWIATDSQNSSLKYNITWFKNNLSNINLTNLDYTSNTLKVDILDFRNLTKGQSWKAMITVHDGEFNTYANTSELLILNSVPSIPLLNYPINDTYLSNSTPEFLINNSDDIDNNQVYYILEIDDSFTFNSINYYNGTIRKIVNTTNSHNITTSLSDSVYYWRARATDLENNSSYTEIRNFIIDTINPTINYSDQTPLNNTYRNYSHVLFNWSYTEVNLANITFRLFNLTNQVNITTYNTTTYQINFTNLSDTAYTYNVTVIDLLNKINTTETRTLNIDIVYPSNLTLLTPVNSNLSSNRTPFFSWTNITEINFANYTLEIDDDSDISSPQFTILLTGNISNSTYQLTQLLNDNTAYSWMVTAADLANNRISAKFTYTTSSTTPSTGGGSSSGGGGGGSSGGGRIVLADIEIIEPGLLTMYGEDTIIAPIILRNKGTNILNGITVSAESNTTNISLALDKTFIPQLIGNQEDKVLLTIKSLDNSLTGQYEINLKARVLSPAITDTAKLIISLIGKDSGKKNEAVKQLEFLKKLFEGNPECLELHELVTQAEEAIKLSQYDKALSLADAAVQSCKDLVSSKGKELKLPKQIRINDIVILIVELISFSFISYGIYYYYRRRKLKFRR